MEPATSALVKREIAISTRQLSANCIVRRATEKDVDSLGVIGPAAYAASYGQLWDNSGALAQQLATFSAKAFAQLLSRADVRVWVVEIDKSIVGFLSMIVGSANPTTLEAGGAEIPRIYLLPGAQNRGLGKQLLDAAISQATDENLGHVWLDVMASAGQARRAYLNWGFTEIGARTFGKPVKAGLAEMVVLIKHLN
jgi:diamine N-acetyltransferase